MCKTEYEKSLQNTIKHARQEPVSITRFAALYQVNASTLGQKPPGRDDETRDYFTAARDRQLFDIGAEAIADYVHVISWQVPNFYS